MAKLTVNKGVPKMKTRTTTTRRTLRLTQNGAGNKNYTVLLAAVFIAILGVLFYVVLN